MFTSKSLYPPIHPCAIPQSPTAAACCRTLPALRVLRGCRPTPPGKRRHPGLKNPAGTKKTPNGRSQDRDKPPAPPPQQQPRSPAGGGISKKRDSGPPREEAAHRTRNRRAENDGAHLARPF